jgi:hypothetical protein
MPHVARQISTLKMEVIRSSETSVQMRTTSRYNPEDGNSVDYLIIVYLATILIAQSVQRGIVCSVMRNVMILASGGD